MSNKFLQKVTFLRRSHDKIALEAKLGFYLINLV